MNIETLVVTMNQECRQLVKKMNIQTDAIIGNQCKQNQIEEFKDRNLNIKVISLKEKGVGLNRNTILMRANADFVVFADDDMVFHDGYPDVVLKAFNDNPKADVIIFNLDEDTETQFKNNKKKKINKYNYMRYGAARFVMRTNKIKLNNIYFNLNFGGGTKFSAGEDSLFLKDCLKHNLNVIAVPDSLATLENSRESSWFEGYNDKYFFDKGVFYYFANPRLSKLYCIYYYLKYHKRISYAKMLSKMLDGVRYAKKIKTINYYRKENDV